MSFLCHLEQNQRRYTRADIRETGFSWQNIQPRIFADGYGDADFTSANG
jgi:hypothetical protein